MPTNLDLDDELIRLAKELGQHRTKRDAVNAALAQYVRRLQLADFRALAGTVEYDPGYDRKAVGRRKAGRMRE